MTQEQFLNMCREQADLAFGPLPSASVLASAVIELKAVVSDFARDELTAASESEDLEQVHAAALRVGTIHELIKEALAPIERAHGKLADRYMRLHSARVLGRRR
jgi:hypothetical protein